MLHAITIGDLERAIYELSNYFNVDYNGLTNRECIEKLRKLCDKLHSDSFLKQFSKNLLFEIKEEFGFTGLRVWYSLTMKHAVFSNELLSMKYFLLHKDILNFVNEYCKKEGIELVLDIYLAGIYLKKSFMDEFGFIDVEENKDLYYLLRTIHLSDYNPILINELHYLIEMELWKSQDKYFIKKDLRDEDILKELFIYLGEEFGDDEVYKGHKLFYDYDGYGGIEMRI